MSNPMIWLQIAMGSLACFILGCSPVVQIGKPLYFPKDKDVAFLGITSFTQSVMTNREGKPIVGVILRDASLIRNPTELANSKHRQYVIFWDFLMGNGVGGAYWEQQS